MFDRKKVTDDNVKTIANAVLEDPLLVKTLLLYDYPGEDPRMRAYRRGNAYRIVYFFVSLVEYLDRTVGASYKEFMTYSSQVYHEMDEKKYDLHVRRCKDVETGKNDFLVRAANAHEHTDSDVLYISMMLAHFEENSYNALLDHCRALLPENNRSNFFKTLFKISVK